MQIIKEHKSKNLQRRDVISISRSCHVTMFAILKMVRMLR